MTSAPTSSSPSHLYTRIKRVGKSCARAQLSICRISAIALIAEPSESSARQDDQHSGPALIGASPSGNVGGPDGAFNPHSFSGTTHAA
jgi:hypothetical protein